jgi:MoaA/NifB/PqqE/SkfB family radical SAM enzyme
MCEKFLTFVVPASNGCNLRCPFCIIRQRNEVDGISLQPHELVQFIEEVSEREVIHALSIQGYEPLLPESMPYTQAILQAGLDLCIPTNFVTNGVYLSTTLDLLTVLKPNAIAISVDSHVAENHDRLRGVPGTWHTVVAGLRQAVKRLAVDTQLVVSSVLFPSKVENLLGMPALLADVGISRWQVNPITAINDQRGMRRLKQDIEILQAGLELRHEADKHGILFAIDDDIDLVRLTPSGQGSIGRDILSPITSDVPRWIPNVVHAADFLAALPRPKTKPCVSELHRDNRQAIH